MVYRNFCKADVVCCKRYFVHDNLPENKRKEKVLDNLLYKSIAQCNKYKRVGFSN